MPAALTSFHFLTARAPKLCATDVVIPYKTPLTRKWRWIQQLYEEMWEIIHDETLNQIQKRNKWKNLTENYKVGDIVLLKDRALTPAEWPMGRITNILPDHKKNVRQVELRTSRKEKITRITSQLIPIVTEEEEEAQPRDNPCDEPPPPRRNPPRRARLTRATNVASHVLACWLTLVNPTIALLIHTLSPGIDVLNLGSVQRRMTDLNFTITTNQNLTNDLNNLQTALNTYHDECNSLNQLNHSTLANYCFTNSALLLDDFKALNSTLQQAYQSKKKRALPSVVSLIYHGTKILGARYGAQILVGATLAYHTYAISSLSSASAGMDEKMHFVSTLSMHKTDLQFESIDKTFEVLREHQETITLEQKLVDFTGNIRNLILQTRLRHENVWKLVPFAELNDYLFHHKEKFQYCQLPEVFDDEDLFTYEKPRKYIKNDIVHLEYIIPLISKENLTEYAIVSTPLENKTQIALPNGKMFLRLVLSEDNNTFFIPQVRFNSPVTIYEEAELEPINECINQLLDVDNKEKPACEKTIGQINSTKNFSAGEDKVLITQPLNETFQINCPDETRVIDSQINWIIFPDCDIIASQQKIIARQHELEHFHINVPNLNISYTPIEIEIMKKPTVNPAIKKLDIQIREALDKPAATFDNSSTLIAMLISIGSISLIFLAAFIFIGIAMCRRRRRNDITTSRRNFIEEFALELKNAEK